MSASNTLEAEDPAHARELADRRDAKLWRKLRAMGDTGALVTNLLTDRDHHFARAEQAASDLSELEAKCASLSDELDALVTQASYSCEEPCGSCAGCDLANEELGQAGPL